MRARNTWVVSVATCALLAMGVPALAARMRFRIAPETVFATGGANLGKALPSGTAFLYRIGDVEPRLRVPLNEFQEIPAGDWLWRAEAEGYSTLGGQFAVPEFVAEKTLVWPAVPSCHVVMDSDSQWGGVTRLDAVSLSRQLVVPLVPAGFREAWIPEGPLLVYSVGSRGVIGISRVKGCSFGSTLKVPPPSPPPAQLQDLMVTLTLPASGAYIPKDMGVGLVANGGRRGRVPPAAVVVQGTHWHYFFLSVSAAASVTLNVEHPKLRTVSVGVQPLGGAVQELPNVELQERGMVKLAVDYEPLRTHRHAVIEAYSCGTDFKATYREVETSCRKLDVAVPLRAGPGQYEVRELDNGAYALEARVDDEVIPLDGPESWPSLSTGVADPEEQAFVLKEFQISGRILLRDEAVPGEVVSYPLHESWPTRRFPTDEKLRYHLFYFGHPVPAGDLPAEARGGSTDRTGAGRVRLTACGAGFCSATNANSVVLGGGELDWTLDPRHRLSVEVLDAQSRRPLVGARVTLSPAGKAMLFDNGQVTWFSPHGVPLAILEADAEGRVESTLPEGARGFDVHKIGYKGQFVKVGDQQQDQDSWTTTVLMERDLASGSMQLQLPTGTPLAHAFVLVIGQNHEVDVRCSRGADENGGVDFPPECGRSVGALVVHPSAALSFFPGGELTQAGGPVSVEPKLRPPLRLRFIDERARPVAGVPIELDYDFAAIGPNDFLRGLGEAGQLPFYTSDSRGEIVLQGIDPGAAVVPAIRPLVDGYDGTQSLGGYHAGDTIDVVIKKKSPD